VFSVTILKGVKSAAQKTSADITRDLRSELLSAGWPSEAVAAVKVVYNDLDGFTAKITGQHKQLAENLEYGTEAKRPTAAIRHYFNTHPNIEALYKKALETSLGVKL
jgi:hypothetical protein